MIDIQNLKENLSETIDNLSRRGFEFDKDYWLKTEKKRKKIKPVGFIVGQINIYLTLNPLRI